MAGKSLLLLAVTALALWIQADAQECPCFFNIDYQCGVDGKTYDNQCLAECAGVAVAYAGQCQTECVCPFIYLPLCGTDGQTYGNDCELACHGATEDYPGECVPDSGDGDKDKLTKDQKRLIKEAWKLCKKGN